MASPTASRARLALFATVALAAVGAGIYSMLPDAPGISGATYTPPPKTAPASPQTATAQPASGPAAAGPAASPATKPSSQAPASPQGSAPTAAAPTPAPAPQDRWYIFGSRWKPVSSAALSMQPPVGYAISFGARMAPVRVPVPAKPGAPSAAEVNALMGPFSGGQSAMGTVCFTPTSAICVAAANARSGPAQGQVIYLAIGNFGGAWLPIANTEANAAPGPLVLEFDSLKAFFPADRPGNSLLTQEDVGAYALTIAESVPALAAQVARQPNKSVYLEPFAWLTGPGRETADITFIVGGAAGMGGAGGVRATMSVVVEPLAPKIRGFVLATITALAQR